MPTHSRTTSTAIAAVPEAEIEAPARRLLPAVRPTSKPLDGPSDATPDRDRRRDPRPPEQTDGRPARGPAQFRLDFCEPISPEELDAAAECGFSDPLDFVVERDGRFSQVTLSTDEY